MTKFMTSVVLGFLIFLGLVGGLLHLVSGQAIAEDSVQRTIRLVVMNMDCAACADTVKKSLEAMPGFVKAVVSDKDKTVVIVTYDANKTTPAALVKAATDARHPSAMKH
jgi:mercuric transport protein